MKALQICIVTTSDLIYDQRLSRISKSLEGAGFHVSFFSRSKHGQIANAQQNIIVKAIFKKSFLFYLEFNIRLFVKLVFRNWDIVYSSDADTLLAAALANLLKRKKLIFDAHEYFEESPEIVDKPFVQWVWESICRFGIPKASLCLTVSKSLADALSKKYKVPFLTIRNLPEKQKSIPRSISINNIIWYQGVLNIGRGLEQMISAMVHLPEFEFHLAGEGDLSNNLRKIVEDLGLYERVKFLGWKHPNELHELASNAYIGINLLDGFSSNYYHSLANKTFDYIQAGLPSIHMDFPEYRDLKKHYGATHLIPDLSEASIIAAIKQMQDPIFHAQLKQECLAASQILIWQEEEKLLVGALENM